ncbi:MAG: hypothetical protein ACR2FP_01550 [Nocardioidaceae bacterium]
MDLDAAYGTSANRSGIEETAAGRLEGLLADSRMAAINGKMTTGLDQPEEAP